MPRRLVADSNVLISALHRRGKPQAILDLARAGEVELYLSPFILDEVAGIVSRKLGWDDERVGLARLALRAVAHVVDPGRPRLHALADETDNRILECAVAAHGRYLVTGDRGVTPAAQVPTHSDPRSPRFPHLGLAAPLAPLLA